MNDTSVFPAIALICTKKPIVGKSLIIIGSYRFHILYYTIIYRMVNYLNSLCIFLVENVCLVLKDVLLQTSLEFPRLVLEGFC